MEYVEIGVKDASTHQHVKTKSALKALVKDDPTKVGIYVLSLFHAGTISAQTVAELPTEHRYPVAGPNPQTDRKWFATVEYKNGKWVVN